MRLTFSKNGWWQEDCVGVPQTLILLAHVFIRQNVHLKAHLQKKALMLYQDGYLYELTQIKDKDAIFKAICQKGSSFLSQQISRWKRSLKRLDYYKGEAAKGNIGIYEDFYEYAISLWSFPILCESGDYFSTNDLVPLIQKRLDMAEKPAREIAILMSRSPKLSFLNKEKMSLISVALGKKSAKEHSKEYFWMGNTYRDHFLCNEGYFLQQARELKKKYSMSALHKKMNEICGYEEQILGAKAKLNKEYTFDPELKLIFRIFEKFSWWVDQRKVMMLKIFDILFSLTDQLDKKNNWPDVAKYLTPEEMKKAIAGSQIHIPKTRKQNFAYLLDYRGKHMIYEGEPARRLLMSYQKSAARSEIKGMVASGKGRIHGKACIILDAKKDIFIPGSIMITSMTRPDFVHLMRQAKAIITDEGGLTCHAAIVARELGIPCIIGTRNASKALRNGQKIVLDLDTGRVCNDQ